SVDGELEATASARDQCHSFDTLLVLGQELARQTDGFWLITSLRAILEFHVHDLPPLLVAPYNHYTMTAIPITIIVRHPRENPKKCSVLPLHGRDDVLIVPYPPTGLPSLEGYIRLAADGPE